MAHIIMFTTVPAVRQKRDPKEIGISSVRGGSIVGDHEVLFCGPDEVITLKHTAYSRSIFANGAVNAAVYLAKKEPGLYNMGDMIAAHFKKPDCSAFGRNMVEGCGRG